MKKRILSLVTVILLFSLLLCSCAEGLPLSELALVAGERATLFSARVETLLTDGVPLAIDGKSDFAVVWSINAPAEVQGAVADFCAQFQAYSGAALAQGNAQSAKRRILIGVADTDAAKAILATLSPATFYIGFAGGDLLILAQSNVMLCTALRYFADTYLQAESAGGKRDVLLPSDLSYTAPTLLCEDDAYTILRAEQSGEGTVQAMSQLFEEIRRVSGARLTRKTDFNYNQGEREILLGHPNHPKANEILATLPRDAYYIGVKGQTLMILAQNDLMLGKAVERFLSLFVSANGVVADKKNKQIEFPAACDYYHIEESILLAEHGKSHAVLIYPDNTSALVQGAIKNLCTRYKQLTNTTLEAYADSEYRREKGVFEILVGRTARSESQKLYFDGIAKGEWRMAVDEGGRALAIGANGEFALRAAVEALTNALTAQAAALSHESIYEEWKIKTDVDRLLFLFSDFSQGAITPPDLSGAYSYKLYYGSYLMQQTNVALSRYVDYLQLLTETGFAQIIQTGADGTHTAVYESDTQTVNITYQEANRTLRVQVSPRRQRNA